LSSGPCILGILFEMIDPDAGVNENARSIWRLPTPVTKHPDIAARKRTFPGCDTLSRVE